MIIAQAKGVEFVVQTINVYKGTMSPLLIIILALLCLAAVILMIVSGTPFLDYFKDVFSSLPPFKLP